MGEGEEQVCMGPTGAITRIADGSTSQVVTGLLSAGWVVVPRSWVPRTWLSPTTARCT